MSLTPGVKLRPYEILAPIGAGGMGEVYRAQDTRLERTVAIKVLPSHVASNPDVRARFEREARAVSSLNHPHICTLHDIGHQDGIDFIVMEHIEGETLSARIGKGALPLDQALQYGIGIADALDKAHRQGVVHRDLKPGNIMLTKSGAKLLDFGLAKLEVAGSGPDLSALPTEQKSLTQPGAILGTFQYMAPEQLEGNEADARTDIFAFGSVLYEMVTGRRAFEGKSQASLIAAILEREPPAMSTLQTMTPPVLDHVVRMCLAKDPDERWQSASDVMRQLKWVTGAGSAEAVVSPGQTQSRLVPVLAIGMVVAALVAGLGVWALMRSTPEPTLRLSINLPHGTPMTGPFGTAGTLALSPDGSRLAYVGETGGARLLYVRSLDQLDFTPLAGTENALYPFFSPDGEWIGFFEIQAGTLKKISVRGGPAMTLCEAPFPGGASWGTQNTIVFASGGDLFRVPATGGASEVLTTPDSTKDERAHRWPEVLPDGKGALFSIQSTSSLEPKGIAAVSLESGKYHTVLEYGYFPHYAQSGHLLFFEGGTLMAAPFDLEDLETRSAPTPVLEGISAAPRWGSGSISLSRDGSLAYLPARGSHTRLVWVDREGREVEPLVEEPLENPRGIRLSPDGRRLAIVTGLGDPEAGDLWVFYLDNRPPTRLTFDGTNDRPVWILDGASLAFASGRTGSRELHWIPADGSRLEPEQLLTNDLGKWPRAWSHETKELLFDQLNPGTIADVMAVRLDGKREPRVVIQTAGAEGLSRLSSDGRWLAYVSNLTGRFEVLVQPFPGPGAPVRVSTNGGVEPIWGPKDQELYYIEAASNSVMAVKVSTEPTFTFGPPEVLFEGTYLHDYDFAAPTYDVAPDGRFLMIKPVTGEDSERTELIVVLNWFEELERLVPTK